MDRPRGVQEWKEQEVAILQEIRSLERRMGEPFLKWEQLHDDLAQWISMRPNAPESDQ